MRFLWLGLAPALARAAQYGNQSTSVGSSSITQKSNSEAFMGDCASKNAEVSEALATISATPVTITPTPTIEPFVDYWCSFHRVPNQLGEKGVEDHPEVASGYFAKDNTNNTERGLEWGLEWGPIVTPPCCNVYCDIKASAVELVYWPKSSASLNISTLVDSTGFTFTLSSVYVVYKHLSAYNDCGVLGQTFASLTKAYKSDAILTHFGGIGEQLPLNYDDLWENCGAKATPDLSISMAATPAPVITQHDPVKTPTNVPAVNNGPVNNPPDPSKQESTSSKDPPANVPLPNQAAPSGPKETSSAPVILAAGSQANTGNGVDPGSPTGASPAPQAEKDPAHVKSEGFINPGVAAGGQMSVVSGSNGPFSQPVSSSPAAAAPWTATPDSEHAIHAPSASSVIVDDGQSITQGGSPISISDAPVALQSNGNLVGLVVGTSTVSLFNSSNPSSVTIAGQSYPMSQVADGIVIAGTTLRSGQPAFTIAGVQVSVSSGGLLVGASTVAISSSSFPSSVIIAGHAYAVSQAPDGIVITGTTIRVGQSAVTIEGMQVSAVINGLVVGTSTISLPLNSPLPSTVTIAGQAYGVTMVADGILIAGMTIQLGQTPVTISGTPVGLMSSVLIIGSSTIPLQASVGPATPGGLGGLILSGLGGLVPSATVGSQPTSQPGLSGTGKAFNGTEFFRGDGCRVATHWATLFLSATGILLFGL
ncbi:MAG: hypothetical protein M1812_003321 [Candelaria pacifica]|nr:MAG: hypothetical protein M1812_003321 [Candelaria pacifica]